MTISSINNLAARERARRARAARGQTDEQRNLIQAAKARDRLGDVRQDNELTFVLDRAPRRAVTRIVNQQTGEVEFLLKMCFEWPRG